MRIYEMTATFGKLEHAKLTLQPGLNVIQAPNEWGKSTWCAFLLAMLYGLDTRAKTTKTALANKERYAPWSGTTMSGRIDLCWNGRDITIERRTRGRIPLGDFRAYETASGLAVPELTAANCGAMLLGVEQSVFRRAGFIRLADMPVTQDDALRSRLNALVTTGDESGDGERLARGLRELKNRCRYNRTGLIPQAEAERAALEEKLRELEELTALGENARSRIGELDSRIAALENHRAALSYAAYREDVRREEQARIALDAARQALEEKKAACAGSLDREDAEEKLRQLTQLRRQLGVLREEALLLQPPRKPEEDPVFSGLCGGEALERVEADSARYRVLRGIKPLLPFLIPGILLLAAGMVLAVLSWHLYGEITLGLGKLLLAVALGRGLYLGRQAKKLAEKYGSSDPSRWLSDALRYDESTRSYLKEKREYEQAAWQLERRKAALATRQRELCPEGRVEDAEDALRRCLKKQEDKELAQREFSRAEEYLQGIRTMVKPVPAPERPDHLVLSGEETLRQLEQLRMDRQHLMSRCAHFQGKMEALGSRDLLEKALEKVQVRIRRLEDTNAALTVALETLAQARMELQRRFAPRISRRAQELMSSFTQGRYRTLSLNEDFSLQAGAGEEDTLRDALWRSEGTVDQLYLALRLAVAEELTPEAPLVLDDALVRFDDARLKAAMEVLSKIAEKKQVLLFTCQSREANLT